MLLAGEPPDPKAAALGPSPPNATIPKTRATEGPKTPASSIPPPPVGSCRDLPEFHRPIHSNLPPEMRRVCVAVMISLAACAPQVTASGPSPTAHSTSSATPSASVPPGSGEQDRIPGPGGMTLRQEIGAVMMVGFKGALS